MMLVSTLFGSLFAGGGAAAAAGTAAAATTSTVSLGSIGMTLLQGVGSIFTGLSAINAGKAQAEVYKAQAKEQEFAARDEQIKGEQEAARLNKDLTTTLQRQQVAFAAAGVDLGSQAVGAAQDEATTDFERELSFSQYDAVRASQSRLRQAYNLRLQAKSAVQQGQNTMMGELVKFGMSTVNRFA